MKSLNLEYAVYNCFNMRDLEEEENELPYYAQIGEIAFAYDKEQNKTIKYEYISEGWIEA